MVKLKIKNMRIIIMIIFVLMLMSRMFSQNNDNFYIVDTIVIKNPIVFSIPKYDGLFVTDLENLNKKNIKPKNIRLSSEVFFFSFNPYIFIDDIQNNKQKLLFNYPDYGNCFFNENISSKEKIYYNTFKINPLKFIVCLVKANHYNKIISTTDIGKTILYKIEKNFYYKIVFPLCEGNVSD
jgi:hypothetical protein